MDKRFLDVNRYAVLAVPASFYWCCAFLLRHWILIVVVAASASRSPLTAQWAYGDLSWVMLLMEVPMLLLLSAWVRRIPEAGRVFRLLWARGREIISATALLNMAWAVWFLMRQDYWNPWPERFVCVLFLLDLAIVVGVWKSDLYRQLFSEFPARPVAPVAKATRK